MSWFANVIEMAGCLKVQVVLLSWPILCRQVEGSAISAAMECFTEQPCRETVDICTVRVVVPNRLH